MIQPKNPVARSASQDESCCLPREVLEALRLRGVDATPAPEVCVARHAVALDTALMALFRDTRSNAVFDALYERSRDALQSWVMYLLVGQGQLCDPIEIVQDTYVNIYRYARSFKEGGGHTFRAWARTIAGTLVRRARTLRARSSPLRLLDCMEPEDLRDGPLDVAEFSERREELGRAWILILMAYIAAHEKLAPRDREALRLVEVEGLDYGEAAALLGVTRKNMKMIMFRSRKRIRSHMGRLLAANSSTPENWRGKEAS